MSLSKATKITLFDFKSIPMRAFHMSWIAFFFAFFAWFGVAPLMAVIRDELGLTRDQVATAAIASVSITIFARLLVGWLCDKFGPRRVYLVLLSFSALPVIGIGLSDSFESFLVFRLLIGTIGASFVITQFHTSLMFAPNVVGTANATTAGWGNLGGGVTNMLMPLIFTLFMGFGLGAGPSWRLSMVVAGLAILVVGILYFALTKDTPNGNYAEMAKAGLLEKKRVRAATVREVIKNYRVWLLFLVYGACFGIELTLNNYAALYFADYFQLEVATAGLIAGLFGLMNLFARTLGGVLGDRFGMRWGLQGRVWFMVGVLALEGLALILFSRMTFLPLAIGTLVLFSLFVQASEGATFAIVPFVNKKAVGTVSGIVGAGGNVGAMLAGLAFKTELSFADVFMWLGVAVLVVAGVACLLRLKDEPAEAERSGEEAALAAVAGIVPAAGPAAGGIGGNLADAAGNSGAEAVAETVGELVGAGAVVESGDGGNLPNHESSAQNSV